MIPSATADPNAQFSLDIGKTAGTISPLIFGHNLEHTRHSVWKGVSAEMIANRKFADAAIAFQRPVVGGSGITDEIMVRGEPDPDGVAAHWYGIGKPGARFMLDDEIAYAAAHTQRVNIDSAGVRGGVGQGDIALKDGTDYNLRVCIRAHFKSKVIVRITDKPRSRTYLEETANLPMNQWQEWVFSFTAPASDIDARLEIIAEGPATIWLGAVSMMPADNFRGMRRDVIDLLKEMSVPYLRWPGGNYTRNFRWKDGLLPVDRRPPTISKYYRTLPFSDGLDFHEIGIDEFLALCEELGAEPSIVLNITDSVQSAVDLLEYCNGSAGTEWGRIRAERGHSEPYNVKDWSIGNEIYGIWMGPAHFPGDKYPEVIARFATAMKEADPSIQIIGCGIGTVNGWNRDITAVAGQYIDLLSAHHYGPFPGAVIERKDLDQGRFPTVGLRKILADVRAEIDDAAPPGKHIPITFDEWNVWHEWFTMPFEREWHTGPTDGMYVASALNMLCREQERLGIHSAVFFEPINEGCITVKLHSSYLTSAGKVFKLFQAHHGNKLLVTPIPPGDEDIDLCASISADGKRLVATALNRNSAKEMAVELKLAGNQRIKSARAVVLAADDLTDPDAVFIEKPLKTRASGGAVSIVLPEYGVALVEIDL
ncbi:alpha-L-arabinofuranosidase C-terminal domain-containing protein [candidate division KSB1 bacterium]